MFQIIPASFILASPTDKDLGSHCLEYTNPDFREKVRAGFDIVVAGKAFGCGSSREEAPRALKGKPVTIYLLSCQLQSCIYKLADGWHQGSGSSA